MLKILFYALAIIFVAGIVWAFISTILEFIWNGILIIVSFIGKCFGSSLIVLASLWLILAICQHTISPHVFGISFFTVAFWIVVGVGIVTLIKKAF